MPAGGVAARARRSGARTPATAASRWCASTRTGPTPSPTTQARGCSSSPSTSGAAAGHADKIGGRTLNGLGGRPATVFAGAITMQRTLNVSAVRDVTVNFGSFARGAQFTILHEFQHFQGIRAGPIGERLANRNVLRAMGINF